MRTTASHQSWRAGLLSGHIAASVGVLGADLALLGLGAAGTAGADPLLVYPAARLIAAWVVTPLALLALGTGLSLGLLTSWGLFTHWWVVIKLSITTALTAAVLFVLVPGLAETSAAVSGSAPQTLTTTQRLPLLVAPAIASALLILSVLLAVFKPRWRLRSMSRDGGAEQAAGSHGKP